ncbi:MAG: hydantoinase B/oxoprolinase family protein [Pseudomonadota bacterium]
MNPITLQIVWDRLLALVEEQAQTLIRTAFSTTVREAGDLSAGVFDAQGQMLAQAITGTPGHVNAMAASVKHFLHQFPAAELKPGDVLVTNDPWHGTGHLNDFTVVTPVFFKDRMIGLMAATSHIADVGGLGFGPEGRQVYEEGLTIPISRLFTAGEVNETLLEILRANVRDPRAAEGDLYSLATCNHTAGKRLTETLEEFGLSDLEAVGAMIIERSRTAMVAELHELPEESWRYEMVIDGYADPVTLAATVSRRGNQLHVDFSGSSPASERGINVPLTYTQAYASFGVRCVVGNDIPNNAGSLGAVHVTAPEGCILNAPRPCAVSARHAVGQMLPDVVLGCLAQPLGGQVPAEGASCLFGPVFLGGEGQVAGGTGEPFVINAFYAGGTGARPQKDGLDCTAFPSGVRSTPVEILENSAPLVVWKKQMRPGSGGAGEFRGGLGQEMAFGHVNNEPFVVSRMFDRLKHPPRGRGGGGAGAPAWTGTSAGEPLSGMGRCIIPEGQHFVLITAGGGGRGQPEDRAEEAADRDRLNGLDG